MEAGNLEGSATDLAEVNGNGGIVAKALNVERQDPMGSTMRGQM